MMAGANGGSTEANNRNGSHRCICKNKRQRKLRVGSVSCTYSGADDML